MFNISLLLSAAVIIICVLANKLSNKIGMPVLYCVYCTWYGVRFGRNT